MSAHEKINGHRELTVSSRLWGPMIMAQSRLGEITAQSRRGHSSVTARSNSVTARSQLNHGIFSMITTQSPLGHLNHGPGHGSVLAGCDHFGHRELTMSSRWPIFSHGWVLLGSTRQPSSHWHPGDAWNGGLNCWATASTVKCFHWGSCCGSWGPAKGICKPVDAILCIFNDDVRYCKYYCLTLLVHCSRWSNNNNDNNNNSLYCRLP